MKALKLTVFAGLVFCLVALASAPAAAQGARVWEESLTIPTYELGPPDPNPPFAEWGRRRPIYPYPVLDTITNRKVDKEYKAVYLENEYLKVTVLPELGGHVYAIYDKTAGRDVLYTNHVVKYGIVGIRGAWVSGGIEWNFPDGHTVTTVSPIDYTVRTEPDGSAVVFVGDTERIQRMQWCVALRLRPGRKYLESEVTLNNRREVPGRFWYWATAAAQAADDLRFVYPMREAYPHTFWPVFSFPKEKGVDVGTYREVPNALSLFARNSYRDFFGVYYEKSDWGVVHVADHREVAGKKTWTWGTDDAGAIWVEKLTDKDGQYVEFQAGRYETQMEHQFIAPHRVLHFTEYWFALNKMGGGFDEANQNGALKVTVNGSHARVTASVTARHENAEIIVNSGGRTLHTGRVAASPEAVIALDVDVPSELAGKPVEVALRTAEGQELIRYSTDTPVDGNAGFRPATRPDADPKIASSAEQAYVAGVAADKKSDERHARTAYVQALERDPNYSPAHIALGLSYYRSGEYDRAASHLVTALRRNPDAGDAHYYLALVRRAQGKVQEAREHLAWCVREGRHEQVARYVLGEMALATGHLGPAMENLRTAASLDPRDLKARTALAMAQRLAGLNDGALLLIDQVLEQEPLDYLALLERFQVLEAMGRKDEAKEARMELARLLNRDPDLTVEAVFDYLALGQAADAARGLSASVRALGADSYPMWQYLLGYLYERAGDGERARAQYAEAAKHSPAFVWPHRVEEIAVLQAAVKANPEDGRAAYYLGNALASKGRFEEALVAWQQAAKFDSGNAVALRNLAQALFSVKHDTSGAVETFQKAIAAAPDDFHLYIERDRVLAAAGQNARRIALLEKAPEPIRSRGAVVQALADAYADTGRFRDAVRLLEGAAITSGEGEAGGLAIYRRALTGMAREESRTGRHAEAAALYIKATEYPRNFGVGKSSHHSQARDLMAAVAEFEKAGKTAEAQRYLKEAAGQKLSSPSEPNEPWSDNYYYTAVALERTGRAGEARAIYQRLAALADDANMPEREGPPAADAVRFLLAGLGLDALGEKARATAMYEKALKLDPGNELAKTKLVDADKRRSEKE